MTTQTARSGQGLATLAGLRVVLLPGQRIHLEIEVDDLDFIALRFGGHQGFVDAMARALGKMGYKVDGTAGVKMAVAGRILILVGLRSDQEPTDMLIASVAEMLRNFLGSAKFSWSLQIV